MHLFFVTRRMSFDPCRYSYLTEIHALSAVGRSAHRLSKVLIVRHPF